MRIISFIILFVALSVFACAQPGTSLISGTITEKGNFELAIYKTQNKLTQQLAGYIISPGNQEFAFVIPSEKETSYSFVISVMKQGHMRLEVDKRITFPLQVKHGENLSLNITPSALDDAKKKGVEKKNNSSELSFVTGNLVNSIMGGEVGLAKVVNGNIVPVTSFFTTKTNKRFQLAIPVKQEGFYYFTSARVRDRIYLKPGDQVELNANHLTGTFEIINGSEENQVIDKWQKLFLPATQYGYNLNIFQNDTINLENYFANYQKLQPSVNDFKSQIKTSNDYFNRLFGLAIDLDNECAPMGLFSNLSARRFGNKNAAKYDMNNPPAFYKQFIQPSKFNTAEILKIGEAMGYINLYQRFNLAFLPGSQQTDLSNADRIRIMIDAIANDTLKSMFLKNQLDFVGINNLSEFRATFQPFEKYAFLPEVKQTYVSKYEGFLPDTTYVGKSSYNFSLPDSTGRMFSMKDFKGKVVLIDVWATWCGPCRGQFPFLKEIEEEYHGNNGIVFVAISIDREKDKQKWVNMIRKEELKGIHLLDDMGKTFGNKYGINAVPRYMLINKKGEWIEVRLPLPEAKKELKKYLDEALNQDVTITN